MKHLIPFLISLSFMLSVSAQTWAPTGAKWTFGVGHAFSPKVEYREWICKGDTLIGGHNCKVIQRNGSYVSGDISNKLITYEDSGVVYWYNKNQFTILYDFNKNAGETWVIMTDTCGLLIRVDSTGIDTVNGFPLKMLFISSPNGAFNGKVLEHIGHMQQPNPNIIFHCTGVVEDLNYYTELRCYEDSTFGFHRFGNTPSCDYTRTGIDEMTNPFGLLIFPNPTSNNLNIRADNKQKFTFSIYNLLGQLVDKGVLEANATSIQVNNLKNGVYSIELSADNKTERKSFILEK